MKKREAAGILLLLGVAGLILWWFCGLIRGPSYPVFAYVDKVEPEIPGLIIEATRGLGGELFITNKTGKDVVIFDQGGEEFIRITSDNKIFEKDENDKWVRHTDSNLISFYYPPVGYEGPRPTGWKKQVLSEWVVEGRVGDTPFKIYGRTVYEP